MPALDSASSADSPSPSAASHRRDRAVRLTVAASFGGKALSVACTLAQVPIALHYLGREAYGLWMTLVGVTLLINFVDFGIGVGMQQAMAHAYGRDDAQGVRQAFFTGAYVLTGIAVLVLAAGVPVALLADWADPLKVHDLELRREAGRALAITVAACAFGIPLNAVARLAAAVQRGWLSAGWIVAGSLTTLAAVIAAAQLHWGFLGFLAVATGVPVAQGAGLLLHLGRALRWPFRLPPPMSRSDIRPMLRASLLFAPPQTGLALLQAAPTLVIAHVSGAAAVTAYALLMRLFSPVLQAQILILTPVWPAYTEAKVRNDWTWVRRAHRTALLASAALAVALGLLAWQSAPLIHWWVRENDAVPAAALAWLTASWCALQLAFQPFQYLLVGLGRMRPLAYWGTAGPAAALFGMLALGRYFGTEGVVAGAVAGLALGGLPGLAVAAERALAKSP